MQLYKVDAPQMYIRGRKRATKKKINNFFKVIDESRKTYIEQKKARSDRASLAYYTSKKTDIRNISIIRVLEALDKQGWNIQEATKDM